MKKQRGGALIIMSIFLIITVFSLFRASELLVFMGEKERGKILAKEVLTLIKSWSNEMDYRCVSGNITSINIADLALGSTTKKVLTTMTFVIKPQPMPSFEITVGSLSDIANAYLTSELEKTANVSNLAPLIQVVSVSGSSVKVIATRGLSASEAVSFGKRANVGAVATTIMINGEGQYGITGC